ncbi:prolyl oligopeptidase [Hysterangium stoloniferum]|nr:prolyl oligopeptidase [Hysterangium stoloniferum]
MAPSNWSPNQYPIARRADHFDTWKSEKNGDVKVHDPYIWLETYSDETEKWIDAQGAVTSKFLSQYPDSQKLRDSLTRNMDYVKFSAPAFKRDGRWYWYYNSGLQAQSVLYRSKTSDLPNFTDATTTDATVGEIFFDPNLLSSDGTAAIYTTAFSHSAEYFAYAISLSGSDFSTIYVRPTSNPLAKATDNPLRDDPGRLPEVVRFVKFSSITWTHDNKGFFYQRYPSREEHGSATDDKAGTETTQDLDAKLYYHRIGTQQSEDILVVEDPENREYMFGIEVTEVDGRYLILTVSRDTSRKNLLWVADLTQNEIGPNIKWNKIIDKFDAEFGYIANDGTKFYLQTNKDAPQYRVVEIDLTDPSRNLREFIPENKDAHLGTILAVADDKFVVVYKRNVIDELYIYSSAGKEIERLAADFVGTIEVSGHRERPWFFASFMGFTTPGTKYQYDFRKPNDAWSVYRTTQFQGLDLDEFITKQVWYNSKDGTRVPMFIVRHKDTPLDGTAPVFQYGYGGFSISIGPSFSSSILSIIKGYGLIYAVANIRGGAEFGEEWHLAGTRERKINVFDDFIAATQYLVANKVAAPDKVVINGGSNGGLLVAACINIAPEGTFGAAVAEVGVLDMLKFSQFTIGKAWTSDYGDPQAPHDFDFIYPISPMHNVQPGKKLPATLLMTADHDDRVVPLHSFKHAAVLQHAAPQNEQPLLIRIDRKAGHGAGKSTEKRIEDAVAKYGFIAQTLGLKWRDS